MLTHVTLHPVIHPTTVLHSYTIIILFFAPVTPCFILLQFPYTLLQPCYTYVTRCCTTPHTLLHALHTLLLPRYILLHPVREEVN